MTARKSLASEPVPAWVRSEQAARTEIHRSVPPRLSLELLRLYRAAFRRFERLAPARQAHTDEEFLAEMANPAVVKILAVATDGRPRALSFLSNDLDTVPWISPAYYQAKFPEHASRGSLWYVAALIVDPDHQGGPWASMLLTDVISYVAHHRGVAAFDCCLYNVTTVRLPRLIELVAARHSHGELQELDSQHYYALILDHVNQHP